MNDHDHQTPPAAAATDSGTIGLSKIKALAATVLIETLADAVGRFMQVSGPGHPLR